MNVYDLPRGNINIVFWHASETAVNRCWEVRFFWTVFRCFLIESEEMHSIDVGGQQSRVIIHCQRRKQFKFTNRSKNSVRFLNKLIQLYRAHL